MYKVKEIFNGIIFRIRYLFKRPLITFNLRYKNINKVISPIKFLVLYQRYIDDNVDVDRRFNGTGQNIFYFMKEETFCNLV